MVIAIIADSDCKRYTRPPCGGLSCIGGPTIGTPAGGAARPSHRIGLVDVEVTHDSNCMRMKNSNCCCWSRPFGAHGWCARCVWEFWSSPPWSRQLGIGCFGANCEKTVVAVGLIVDGLTDPTHGSAENFGIDTQTESNRFDSPTCAQLIKLNRKVLATAGLANGRSDSHPANTTVVLAESKAGHTGRWRTGGTATIADQGH